MASKSKLEWDWGGVWRSSERKVEGMAIDGIFYFKLNYLLDIIDLIIIHHTRFDMFQTRYPWIPFCFLFGKSKEPFI